MNDEKIETRLTSLTIHVKSVPRIGSNTQFISKHITLVSRLEDQTNPQTFRLYLFE